MSLVQFVSMLYPLIIFMLPYLAIYAKILLLGVCNGGISLLEVTSGAAHPSVDGRHDVNRTYRQSLLDLRNGQWARNYTTLLYLDINAVRSRGFAWKPLFLN